jgi:hypothetical protein
MDEGGAFGLPLRCNDGPIGSGREPPIVRRSWRGRDCAPSCHLAGSGGPLRRAISSSSCPSCPDTQTPRWMSRRPSRKRPLVNRSAPNARAARHCLPTKRIPLHVARQPFRDRRSTRATSVREWSPIRWDSSGTALPPLKACSRIALQGSPGTKGKCGGLAASSARPFSGRSSHQGTVSSSHPGFEVLAARFLSDTFCDSSSLRLRSVKCRFSVLPSFFSDRSGSAMTSIDAAGHTLSTAETGTTRERRPPSRRRAAPWGLSNRLTRPRWRPFVPIASKPSQCSSQ